MDGRILSFMLRSKSDKDLVDLSDQTNKITLSTALNIEVGDEILVRINSTGEKDKGTWIPGTVVGLHSQHGLWECFLVSVDKSGRKMPCTERLLKLDKKGTQSGKKSGPVVGGIRTMGPVYKRESSGFQVPERFIPPNGICCCDTGN
jgi:hypothetical protein